MDLYVDVVEEHLDRVSVDLLYLHSLTACFQVEHGILGGCYIDVSCFNNGVYIVNHLGRIKIVHLVDF